MKFIPIILGLYFLYYVGMVIYDLFLKKEKVVEAENSEQNYSISDFAQQNKETPTLHKPEAAEADAGSGSNAQARRVEVRLD